MPIPVHRIRGRRLPRHGPRKLTAEQTTRIRFASSRPLIAAKRCRQSIAHSDADREVFAETPAEACELAKFKIYAWVVMDNHYHWVLETPKANLVEGMTWFQN